MVELSGRRFISDKVTESIIERIVAQVGRRIDKSQPLVDARLPDGSRVCIVFGPIAQTGTQINIRRFPATSATPQFLLDHRAVTSMAMEFLLLAVKAYRNILVSGGAGSGRMT